MEKEQIYSIAAVLSIVLVGESSLNRPYVFEDEKLVTRLAYSTVAALVVLRIVREFSDIKEKKYSQEQSEYLEEWNHTYRSSFSESDPFLSLQGLLSYS
jgi:hypothetical protein